MDGLTNKQIEYIHGMETVLDAIKTEKCDYEICGCESLREKIESEVAYEAIDNLDVTVTAMIRNHIEFFKDGNALRIIDGMSRKSAVKKFGKSFVDEVLGDE